MVLIHDFTIVKQYGDKLLKKQQNIPWNRCHIAYIKFAMAVLIIDESVFALRWNEIIEKMQTAVILFSTSPLVYMAFYQ